MTSEWTSQDERPLFSLSLSSSRYSYFDLSPPFNSHSSLSIFISLCIYAVCHPDAPVTTCCNFFSFKASNLRAWISPCPFFFHMNRFMLCHPYHPPCLEQFIAFYLIFRYSRGGELKKGREGWKGDTKVCLASCIMSNFVSFISISSFILSFSPFSSSFHHSKATSNYTTISIIIITNSLP